MGLLLLLLLRSTVGVVMPSLWMDVPSELGSSLKFLLWSPKFVPEVRPSGHRRVLWSVWVGQSCGMWSASQTPVPSGHSFV